MYLSSRSRIFSYNDARMTWNLTQKSSPSDISGTGICSWVFNFTTCPSHSANLCVGPVRFSNMTTLVNKLPTPSWTLNHAQSHFNHICDNAMYYKSFDFVKIVNRTDALSISLLHISLWYYFFLNWQSSEGPSLHPVIWWKHDFSLWNLGSPWEVFANAEILLHKHVILSLSTRYI